MNKLVIYLIALISGVIGVFAFSPFDYWGLAYVSLGGLLFVAKNAKKSTALLATFLWSMGFFCFGVSWLNVSIHQCGGASLGVSYLLVGLLCTLSNAFHVFSATFSGAKCGHFCRDLDID